MTSLPSAPGAHRAFEFVERPYAAIAAILHRLSPRGGQSAQALPRNARLLRDIGLPAAEPTFAQSQAADALACAGLNAAQVLDRMRRDCLRRAE